MDMTRSNRTGEETGPGREECTEAADRTRTAQAQTDARPNRIGYRFPPVPQSLWNAIHAQADLPDPDPELPPAERRKVIGDRLKPIDADVMQVLINFRTRVKDSCWCAKATIAAKIRRTERTVQSSLRRLELHGFIAQVNVATPDPDEPRNKTGWRIVLLFVETEAPKPGPAVDRRTPAMRRKWVRTGQAGEETGFLPFAPLFGPTVSSDRKQQVSSEGEKPVSSKQRAGDSKFSDGIYLDGETPSSSLKKEPETRADDDEASRSLQNSAEPEGPAKAVEAARETFGETVAEQVRVKAQDTARKIHGQWAVFAAAFYLAHKIDQEAARARREKSRVREPFNYALSSVTKGVDLAEATEYRDQLRKNRDRLTTKEGIGKVLVPAAGTREREALEWLIQFENGGYWFRTRPDGRIDHGKKPGHEWVYDLSEDETAELEGFRPEILAILAARLEQRKQLGGTCHVGSLGPAF